MMNETQQPPLSIISVASGVGAGDAGCGDGPLRIQQSEKLSLIKRSLDWWKFYSADHRVAGLDAMDVIADIDRQVARDTYACIQEQCPFLILGGDQSCSAGTWSGVSAALERPLGLIWIDAHMDAHTMETTPSHNIHGMPLAALLGHGDPRLTHILHGQPKLQAENICLIGIRSHEPEEAALLEKLGVHIFYMETIERLGIDQVMAAAKEILLRQTNAVGVCIDVDGIDPQDAPGVGTPEPGGIPGVEFCHALAKFCETVDIVGAEIVEFNPHRDREGKTETLVVDMIRAIFDR